MNSKRKRYEVQVSREDFDPSKRASLQHISNLVELSHRNSMVAENDLLTEVNTDHEKVPGSSMVPSAETYSCKNCRVEISNKSFLQQNNNAKSRRVTFTDVKNVNLEEIPELNDSEEKWFNIHCSNCNYSFGRQVFADEKLYTFRKSDLICNEDNANQDAGSKIDDDYSHCPESENEALSNQFAKEPLEVEPKVEPKEDVYRTTASKLPTYKASNGVQMNEQHTKETDLVEQISMLKYVVLNMMERIRSLEAQNLTQKREMYASKFGKKKEHSRKKKQKDIENSPWNENHAVI